MSLTFLADFARKDGDLERALTLAKEARATFLEIGDEFSAMKTLDLVAQIAMDLGEPERAAWLLGVSDGALERHGAQRQDPDGNYAALVADLIATLGEPGWRKHWTAGQRHGDASAIERALDVVRRSQSST